MISAVITLTTITILTTMIFDFPTHWVLQYSRWNHRSPTNLIFNSLKKWGLQGKVFALTVGGTSDTADLLKEGIQKRWEVPMKDHMFHWQISCCDVITKVVEVAFMEIDKIVSKLKHQWWSRSSPLWHLTSSMLREKLKALGEFSSESIPQNPNVPIKKKWGRVKSVCRITDRIYDIVKGLFEVKRPTANLFLPHLLEIRAYLIQESASSDNFGKGVAQKMLRIFNEYWDHVYLVLSIAAFLDPRYKMKFIEFSFPKPEGGDGDSKATFIWETLRKLYDDYLIQNDQTEYLLADSSSESEDEECKQDGDSSTQNAKSGCFNLVDTLTVLNQFRISVQSTNDYQSQKSNLDLYLEEPILPWTEDFCVLLWWKDNCIKYPHLSKMARDFLAIPFSIASSHEAYYTETREVEKTVLALESEFMNALMCTRSWKLSYKNH